MPLREATFWVGLTVFGTGLFFCFDWDSNRLLWAVGLTVIGAAGVVYSVWRHHQPSDRKLPLWSLLLAVTWLAIGYDFYDRQHQPFPEFDAPQEIVYSSYGSDGPNSCYYDVYGKTFLSRYKGYKLAVGCFVWDSSVDVLDAPSLQVGNLYDISTNKIRLRATWGDSFNEYRIKKNLGGVMNLAILLVPNGVQPSQFTTLRQARAFGVHILHASTSTVGRP